MQSQVWDALFGSSQQVMGGEPLSFEMDGVKYAIRQMSTEEYDDAFHLQSMVHKRLLQMPEISELRSLPCSSEETEVLRALAERLEQQIADLPDAGPQRESLRDRLFYVQKIMRNRTLADEIAQERAILARDRFLTMHLLLDSEGSPYFDLHASDLKQRWEQLSMRVKNAARPIIWVAIQIVESAPLSGQPRASSSS